jgi:hypothetical protein
MFNPSLVLGSAAEISLPKVVRPKKSRKVTLQYEVRPFLNTPLRSVTDGVVSFILPQFEVCR